MCYTTIYCTENTQNRDPKTELHTKLWFFGVLLHSQYTRLPASSPLCVSINPKWLKVFVRIVKYRYLKKRTIEVYEVSNDLMCKLKLNWIVFKLFPHWRTQWNQDSSPSLELPSKLLTCDPMWPPASTSLPVLCLADGALGASLIKRSEFGNLQLLLITLVLCSFQFNLQCLDKTPPPPVQSMSQLHRFAYVQVVLLVDTESCG